MSTKIFCDKCGSELPEGEPVNRFIRGDVNVAMRVRFKLKKPEESHVCVTCIREAVNEPEAFVAPAVPVVAPPVVHDPGPPGLPGDAGAEGTPGLPGFPIAEQSQAEKA